MSIIPFDKTTPLGQLRKIRDALEHDLSFLCDPTDPDDDRTRWIRDMITWSETGNDAYFFLKHSLSRQRDIGPQKTLHQFRQACSLIHEIERQAITDNAAFA